MKLQEFSQFSRMTLQTVIIHKPRTGPVTPDRATATEANKDIFMTTAERAIEKKYRYVLWVKVSHFKKELLIIY